MNDQPPDYEEFMVVNNVPLPERPLSKYPFSRMEVGDSFACAASQARAVRAAAHVYGFKYKMKFVTRVVDDELRVWRIM